MSRAPRKGLNRPPKHLNPVDLTNPESRIPNELRWPDPTTTSTEYRVLCRNIGSSHLHLQINCLTAYVKDKKADFVGTRGRLKVPKFVDKFASLSFKSYFNDEGCVPWPSLLRHPGVVVYSSTNALAGGVPCCCFKCGEQGMARCGNR